MTEAPVPPTTGIDAVDAVLADVAALADRPLTDHALVFDGAHAQLRRTLDEPPAAD